MFGVGSKAAVRAVAAVVARGDAATAAGLANVPAKKGKAVEDHKCCADDDKGKAAGNDRAAFCYGASVLCRPEIYDMFDCRIVLVRRCQILQRIPVKFSIEDFASIVEY